ncbi:MAG: M14 family metallopeptidase [Saprospiraceae bacterium]
MKKILPILFLLCFSLNSRAQQIELFHRVEVKLQGKSIVDLARLGIETDHGVYQHGRSFTTDLSESEIQLVEQAGFETKILIEDMSTYYRLQLGSVSNAVSDRSGECGNTGNAVAGSQYTTPSNYTYGTMGGYQTLDELYAVLDDMHQKFPDLISARAIVSDTIYTHEGRSQYYVRISDNANVDEDEPEMLYTALHHSREPNGMSQLLFFMWHILENYDSDPVLKYLVDNAELYFLPCVNPDGYVRNEMTNPNGGGLWRKNLRDTGDGTFGVDLNRNYGYEWGFDDNGSSPNPGSQVYRGPGPFSEPETRMTRDFCNAHEFRIVLNYHTYGNLLIWPWAYSDELAEPGLAVLGNLISSENNYSAGTSSETVGYQVNGSSDDWMFGGADAYSYTPEVGPGTFGFWPPSDTIDGLNKANVTANLVSGLSTLNYVQARDNDDGSFSLLNPILPISVQRFGFESGPVTVSVTPITSNVLGVSPGVVLDLMQFEKINIQFNVQFADRVASGEEAIFLLQVDNGLVVFEDTLRKTLVGPAIAVFDEPGDDMSQWASFAWGVSTDTYYSAPSSIGDSPNGDYPNDAAFDIISQTITIPADADYVTLRFWTTFAIEPNYDYVTLEARRNGRCLGIPVRSVHVVGYPVPTIQCSIVRWLSNRMGTGVHRLE